MGERAVSFCPYISMIYFVSDWVCRILEGKTTEKEPVERRAANWLEGLVRSACLHNLHIDLMQYTCEWRSCDVWKRVHTALFIGGMIDLQNALVPRAGLW